MKAGAAMSNAEKWMHEAAHWKKKAEDLAGELIEVTRERDELQETLDHIGELAAPERMAHFARSERQTRMLEMLMSRAGFTPAEIPAAEAQGDEDEEEDDMEEDGEEAEREEDTEEVME
jgi:uncharacterized protein Smg (DUF494 family)